MPSIILTNIISMRYSKHFRSCIAFPSYLLHSLMVFLMLLMSAEHSLAVNEGGSHSFDGIHRNEAKGYLQGGDNTVTGFFLGPAFFYDRYLGQRWNVEGAFEAQFGKGKYGLFAKGAYRLPVKKFNFFFSAKAMYNRYDEFNTNEFCYNISAVWEAPYFEVTIGETFIHYRQFGSGYIEPFTFTFGAGVQIRKRTNPWNIGLFFRNYDDFYYENWNINWGIRFNANLPANLKLFGEFVLRPAGSLSQLATKYETTLKAGIKYAW